MRPITTLAVSPGQEVTCDDVQQYDGWAVLYNESGLNVQVLTGLGRRTLPAWTGDKFQLHGPAQGPSLSVVGQVLLSQGNAPSSSITGDLYSDTEGVPPGIFPIALSRQVSVGNQVSTTGTSSVINDGQAAPTEVIEATPQGASSSQLKWNNDGSGVFGGGNDAVDATGKFTAMPADAIPVAAVGPGALDTDVTILPKQIVLNGTAGDELLAGAGDLYIPHGLHVDGSLFGIAGVVTVGDAIKASGGWDASTAFPGAQVTGDIGAAQVGPGALDTDVTILPKQISLDGVQADETFAGAGDLFVPHGIHVAGSVLGTAGVLTVGDAIKASAGWDASTTFPGAQVTGDIAAAQVGPGALDSDVTIAGSQVTGGVAAQGGAFTTNNDVWGFPSENAAGTARWRSTTTFNGTGSGTYNHGFATLAGNQTPNFVGITSNQANSTQTVGVDTLGSTSVHVNEANAWPFYGFAART